MSRVLRAGESSQPCSLQLDGESSLSVCWAQDPSGSRWDVSTKRGLHKKQETEQRSSLGTGALQLISPANLQHQLQFHPDASRALILALDAPRMRILHPVAVEVLDGWALAWLREDTGRVSLEVTTINKQQWSDRTFIQPQLRRVAEVWTSLDARALRCAAPSIARVEDGFAVAWREERGSVPGVYLQSLNAIGAIEGREIRVSTRGVAVEKYAPALASNVDGEWACAFVEHSEAGPRVRLATCMREG